MSLLQVWEHIQAHIQVWEHIQAHIQIWEHIPAHIQALICALFCPGLLYAEFFKIEKGCMLAGLNNKQTNKKTLLSFPELFGQSL